MLVQVSPQRWGPTSFLSHLLPVLLTSGLSGCSSSCHYMCIPVSGTENNTSIWKWHITSTQFPLAKVSSMVMANLGVMGTQKGRGMWTYFRTFMTSNKGHHPSFTQYAAFVYSFHDLEPVGCSKLSSNCCFLTCIQISQKAGKMIWYSHVCKFSTVCRDPHSQRLLRGKIRQK